MAQQYSDELKAQVLGDFSLGMSKSAIAKKYSIGRATVIAWVREHEPPVPTLSDTSQRDELGRLVYEYLVTGFESLIAQNRQATYIARLEGKDGPCPGLYEAIHAGVIAVAQAVDRGNEAQQAAEE